MIGRRHNVVCHGELLLLDPLHLSQSSAMNQQRLPDLISGRRVWVTFRRRIINSMVHRPRTINGRFCQRKQYHQNVVRLKERKQKNTTILTINVVGPGGALVESMTFNRRVVDSTPALAAT